MANRGSRANHCYSPMNKLDIERKWMQLFFDFCLYINFFYQFLYQWYKSDIHIMFNLWLEIEPKKIKKMFFFRMF